MNGIVEYLFGSASYVPHGYCLLWRPDLVAMHAVSDFVIAAAYFSIPVAILYFARKRPTLPHRWVLWSFGAFIILCGLTHLVGLLTLWHPIYGMQGLVKAVTAIVSLATAIGLWPLLPRLLQTESVEELRTEDIRLRYIVDNLRKEVSSLVEDRDELLAKNAKI